MSYSAISSAREILTLPSHTSLHSRKLQKAGVGNRKQCNPYPACRYRSQAVWCNQPDSLQIITTAKKLTVPPLLAVDGGAFLLAESQREVHQVLRAIALHTSVGSLTDDEYFQKGGILLEHKEWEQVFAPWPEAIENAERLRPYDPFSSSLIFPTYPVTDVGNAEEELKSRVYRGAENRYGGEINDAIMERIEYELGIINEKGGFAPYFLVMHDIVLMSSRTCGRGGSGAASIVSYSLFITNVDPIAHHLYFERFLSPPSRQDPPDIDVDFAWDERDGIFAAVFKRFGIEHCARVANHNRFRLRSAIRETARCYGLSDAQITKAVETLFMRGGSMRCLTLFGRPLFVLPQHSTDFPKRYPCTAGGVGHHTQAGNLLCPPDPSLR